MLWKRPTLLVLTTAEGDGNTNSHGPAHGEVRWQAAAALGFETTFVGPKDETRYFEEQFLKEPSSKKELVQHLETGRNTAANIEAIVGNHTNCAVVTSAVHILRTRMKLRAAEVQVPLLPAESILAYTNSNFLHTMRKKFGGGEAGRRLTEMVEKTTIRMWKDRSSGVTDEDLAVFKPDIEFLMQFPKDSKSREEARNELICRYGGDPTALRMGWEVNGCADFFREEYAPLTE